MPKLRYIDNRKKTFGNMKCFGGGMALPKDDDFLLECTDQEAEALLKMKNGNNPIFEKALGNRKKKEVKEEETLEKKDESVKTFEISKEQ